LIGLTIMFVQFLEIAFLHHCIFNKILTPAALHLLDRWFGRLVQALVSLSAIRFAWQCVSRMQTTRRAMEEMDKSWLGKKTLNEQSTSAWAYRKASAIGDEEEDKSGNKEDGVQGCGSTGGSQGQRTKQEDFLYKKGKKRASQPVKRTTNDGNRPANLKYHSLKIKGSLLAFRKKSTIEADDTLSVSILPDAKGTTFRNSLSSINAFLSVRKKVRVEPSVEIAESPNSSSDSLSPSAWSPTSWSSSKVTSPLAASSPPAFPPAQNQNDVLESKSSSKPPISADI